MAERPINFNPIARPYRWLEYLTFGPNLERCRFQFLDQLADPPPTPSVLGDGDGRFTASLLAANPQITVDAVDSSMKHAQPAHAESLPPRPTCSRTAESNPHRRARLQTRRPTLRPHRHPFLPRLPPRGRSRRLAQPHPATISLHEATWLVSEFAIPRRQPTGYSPAGSVVGALYRAFRILTGLKTQRLPGYASAFRQNGFSIADQKWFLGGLWSPKSGAFRQRSEATADASHNPTAEVHSPCQ